MYLGWFIIQRQSISSQCDGEVPGSLRAFSNYLCFLFPAVPYILSLLKSYALFSHVRPSNFTSQYNHFIQPYSSSSAKVSYFIILFKPNNFYVAENLRNFKVYIECLFIFIYKDINDAISSKIPR